MQIQDISRKEENMLRKIHNMSKFQERFLFQSHMCCQDVIDVWIFCSQYKEVHTCQIVNVWKSKRIVFTQKHHIALSSAVSNLLEQTSTCSIYLPSLFTCVDSSSAAPLLPQLRNLLARVPLELLPLTFENYLFASQRFCSHRIFRQLLKRRLATYLAHASQQSHPQFEWLQTTMPLVAKSHHKRHLVLLLVHQPKARLQEPLRHQKCPRRNQPRALEV